MHRSAVGSTAQTGRLRHAGVGAASLSAISREWALGDRVERGVVYRDIGAEGLVEALGRERELLPAIGELVRHGVGDDPGSGELGL